MKLNLVERISARLVPAPASGGPRLRKWESFGRARPWFEKHDALKQLDKRLRRSELSAEEHQLLQDWVNNGYVILKGVIPDDTIDRMCTDIEGLWDAEQPYADLQIEEVRLRESDPFGMSHAALLKVPEEQRLKLRNESRWRVHGFYRFSAAARAIYQDERVKAACSLIFGVEALPQYSINFMYGSRQELHQDTAVFHVSPANYLIGAWLACEDIAPESGPLVYYPGSHRTSLFKRFDNYPQTNLRTCNIVDTQEYNRHVRHCSEQFERTRFLANKGDVLLWHGMLIHGGDAIESPGITRKSHVTHYMPKGMDRSTEVQGPFNWG